MSERDSAIKHSKRQYIIGTAGHIDHGKTALVRALTGVDTDRLPEEKARGITIDLGFAHFTGNITIIDVPGHEKLVKTMVAGVSSIDLMLLVVAADDGVMPQTREHIDIIRLLQIRHGIIAVSKTDLVDADWLKLVEEDVRALLQDTAFRDAPLLHTSAATGVGIDSLAEQIHTSLQKIPPRQDPQIFRMPVDRVFSVRGFGTVLTGTILGGSVKEGDRLQLQPGGKEVRVRGLQSHDNTVAEMQAGYRAAINLAGLESSEAARGMVLTQADLFEPVERLNARFHLLTTAPAPLKSNQRVRLHLHTGEVPARVVLPLTNRLQPGEDTLLQLRLEQPIHTAFGDRFIIRQYSPPRTIGGGTVLQVNPPRYRRKYLEVFCESLQCLEGDDTGQRIPGAFDRIDCTALTLRQLQLATGIPEAALTRWLKQPEAQQQLFADTAAGTRIYFSYQQLETVLLAIERLLERYHRDFPARAGQSEAELTGALEKRFSAAIVRRSLRYGVQQQRLHDNPAFRLAGFAAQLSARDSEAYGRLETLYRNSGLTPPTTREAMEMLQLTQKPFRELLMLFREDRQLIPVDEGLFFHHSAIARLQEVVNTFFAESDELTVPHFKELTQTTRKHAIPLLTWLDKQGVTRRDGDIRRRNK